MSKQIPGGTARPVAAASGRDPPARAKAKTDAPARSTSAAGRDPPAAKKVPAKSAAAGRDPP